MWKSRIVCAFPGFWRGFPGCDSGQCLRMQSFDMPEDSRSLGLTAANNWCAVPEIRDTTTPSHPERSEGPMYEPAPLILVHLSCDARRLCSRISGRDTSVVSNLRCKYLSSFAKAEIVERAST